MKKCLFLILILFSFLTPFLFIACGSKETPPTSLEAHTAEAESDESEKREGVMPEGSQEVELVKAEDMPEDSQEAELVKAENIPEDSPEAVVIPLPTVPDGSVLHLIPEESLGLFYCPSLHQLDTRLNAIAAELLPSAAPPELLASILADTFGAGFESLAELEEIGIDLNRDFSIFFTSLEPPIISAVVHLTEPEAIMQVIEAEAEGSKPVTHNGVTYWSAAGGGGSFAILEDILVFSQQAAVCENAIDTHKGMAPAVTMNSDYASLLTDALQADNLLTAYLDLETIAPMMIAELREEMKSMVDSMQSDPASMGAGSLFEKMLGIVIVGIEQLKSLRFTLQLEETDVQMASHLGFKSDSEIQKYLKGVPQELTGLGALPERAFINGALQMVPDLMLQLEKVSLKLLGEGPEAEKHLEQLLQMRAPFYEAISGSNSFTMNFEDSLLPAYLNVLDLQDEKKARTYMEETFFEQLQTLQTSQQFFLGFLSTMQTPNLYKDAQAGTPEMHNGVEIKSYLFPNFTTAFQDMPPAMSQMMPQAFNFYYAFHEGQLLQSVGASSESIKNALDRMSGTGATLGENQSYQHLAEKLGTTNNVFLAMSPIIAVKSALPLISMAEPSAAAAMQMLEGMMMNLPDSYSIGFAAKVQDAGIDTKLLLTLGDFKQLIQMLSMMGGGFN